MKKQLGILMVLTLLLALLPATVMAHTEDDPLIVGLVAGQTMDAGVVKVWNDANDLYVKYETWGACMEETHLAVATSLDGIPQTKKNNPIPGQFPYSDSHGCVTEYTYEIPLTWDPDEVLYIAAHAALGGKLGCDGETAWAGDLEFAGKNWATYFTYTVQRPPCTNVPALVNGDFETPAVTATEKWDIYPSGTAGLGWTVEWYDGGTSFKGATRPATANLELQETGALAGVSAYEGNQYAELDTDWDGPGGALNEEPANVKIYQDLATCEGQQYTLTYAWSPRAGHVSAMDVYWNGSVVASHAGNTSGWHLVTMNVVATGTTTRLAFEETGPADAYGMFLDAVSVSCATCGP